MSEQQHISAKQWRRDALKSRTEADVVADARQWLDAERLPYSITDATLTYNANGHRVVRVRKGWPDITICCNGRFIGAEAKRPVGGKLDYEQAVTLSRLHNNGAVVVIFRDVEDLQHAMRLMVTPAATLDEIAATLAKGPNVKTKKRQAKQRIATG